MNSISLTDDTIIALQHIGKQIGYAISANASPGEDATGGTVASLSESVMGVTAGLVQIADAINNLAEAVRGNNDESIHS